MQQAPGTIFLNLLSRYKNAERVLQKKNNRVSLIRTLFFLAGLILLVWLANERLYFYFFIVLLLFPVAFGLMIKWHQKIKYKLDLNRLLGQINQEELDRLELKLKHFPEGNEFQDKLHPYTGDLDIFGHHSLFQLINRTTTETGANKLAAALKEKLPAEEIPARQEAVKTLDPMLEWRQQFQAMGRVYQENRSLIPLLLEWVHQPNQLEHKKLIRALAWIMPPLFLLLVIGTTLDHFSSIPAFFAFAINIGILASIQKYAQKTYERTHVSVKALKGYELLIRHIENTHLQDPLLNKLREPFLRDNIKASLRIKKIQLVLDNLESRANMFYHVFNTFLLLDFYWLRRAEIWKKRNQDFIADWFSAIGEWESLNSLAGFAYANKNFVFPEIDDAGCLQAEDMAHPLIPQDRRIPNDFRQEHDWQISLITGSNMSGKSTFLRTIGINLVLAMAGAPVCARKFSFPVLQVFTSMRTQDNLEENISSFYAELKRIRQLLDLIDRKVPVLFLLDEILKGTNSQDRHRGAQGLIHRLNKAKASGFISTHDLELGQMEQELEILENYHFDSRIEHNEIYFDYLLKTGVCHNFNASHLMDKMGIIDYKKSV